MESHYEEADHCISYPAKSCMLLFSFFFSKIEDKAEHGPMKLAKFQKKKIPNECQFNQPHTLQVNSVGTGGQGFQSKN